MAFDAYSGAADLARDLDARGYKTHAASVRDIVAAGSTATEILMGLRWTLEQISADPSLSKELRDQVDTLYAGVNSLL